MLFDSLEELQNYMDMMSDDETKKEVTPSAKVNQNVNKLNKLSRQIVQLGNRKSTTVSVIMNVLKGSWEAAT